MDFKEIKTEAKQKIKGNLWEVWKVIIIVAIISSIINVIVEKIFGKSTIVYFDKTAKTISEMLSSMKVVYNYPSMICSYLFGLLVVPAQVGINLYMLNFIREKEYSLEDLKKLYPKIGILIAINILITVAVFCGSLLFVIPGIILSFAYSMAFYIFADNPDIGIIDCLKKSREMMKGYKFDYFAFCLSFIGWILLCILIVPIIWVVPYIQTATTIYYDKLQKKSEV